MKLKTIITAILLLFVAASVVYLIVDERRKASARNTGPTDMLPVDAKLDAHSTPEDNEADREVVVYYFHGNTRCMTCRTIEAYTKEALDNSFADALNDGTLQWRIINVEKPENEHFIEDFQLTTRSVVLERISGGERRDWKNLQRVWELVRGDKNTFLKYIQDETQTFLNKENR